MRVIAQVKLNPTVDQAKALKATLEAANRACNEISRIAWEKKLFRQVALHKVLYRSVRDQFGLGAQVAVRCIAKVVDAYRLDKKKQRTFKRHGAIAYDSRILTYFTKRQEVSIWLLGYKRTKMPFQAGRRQLRLLQAQQGESDLVLFKGEWYLYACCNFEEPKAFDPDGVIGVDLGIENIATTNDGDVFSSAQLEATRLWYHNRRAVLQSVGTKSAKRRLKKLSKKQANFQKDTNHKISTSLVREAKRTKRAIALEDLKGINTRTRVRKADRAKRMNWSFFQLRSFIEYKAQWAGVPVYVVDPAYTSQRCCRCGHIDKRNRKNQAEFRCKSCHHEQHADLNAAINIRDLGVQRTLGCCQPSYGADRKIRRKPLALAGGS